MNNDDQLRELIRESIVEEGIMDTLFSRWRKNGKWKGHAGRFTEFGQFSDIAKRLTDIYSELEGLSDSFPTASRRLKGNIKRILLDIENLNAMVARGQTEKSFFDKKYEL